MREQLAELDPEMILWEDCDDAIVGYVDRCGGPMVVCYCYGKMVEVFKSKGMSDLEADEWISHNIAGAYVGEKTPMILY